MKFGELDSDTGVLAERVVSTLALSRLAPNGGALLGCTNPFVDVST